MKSKGISQLACTVIHHVLLILALSSLSLASHGCRRGTLLLGAVACQGLGGPARPAASDPWAFNGLDARTAPRIRPGSYASVTQGVRFLDPDSLGRHGYWLNWSERNGIVYTCKAGHIDIAHVRKAVDWTGYLAALTLECVAHGRTEFQFKGREPSLYHVQLTYPENWERLPLPERVRVAREVSRSLGQYLGYTAMTWHEILTWFGFRPQGYKSEFPSAFSWEDTYSNLLGTHIAARALRAEDRDFSEAVTSILEETLEMLEVRSAQEAKRTTDTVRGRWFTKKGLFPVIVKRHLDLGYNDGYVSPCLVSDSRACRGRQAHRLPVPTLDCLAQYGFSTKLKIEPRVWENKRILKVVFPEGPILGRRIEPAAHFPRIMDYIATEAIHRYGHDIGPDGLLTVHTSGSAGGT